MASFDSLEIAGSGRRISHLDMFPSFFSFYAFFLSLFQLKPSGGINGQGLSFCTFIFQGRRPAAGKRTRPVQVSVE